MPSGCRRASARRATGQRSLSEQRTTSKMGMKTTRRTLTCVGYRASYRRTPLGLRNQSCRPKPRRSTAHLLCMCRVFTPRANEDILGQIGSLNVVTTSDQSLRELKDHIIRDEKVEKSIKVSNRIVQIPKRPHLAELICRFT